MKLQVACSLIAAAVVMTAATEEIRYDDYRVHRLIPRSKRDFLATYELFKEHEYDFWKEPAAVNVPVDVMVPPQLRQEFEEFVTENKLEETVLIDDVQRLIDEERPPRRTRNATMNWSDYHTLEEFHQWMDDLEKAHDNVNVILVGKSYERRDIKGVEITFGSNYRTVLLESNIHAREWIAGAATSWIINEIVKSPADSIWRKFNYIYVPFYNPDGYAYSWTTNRMWRKTRTPYKSGSRTCYGADPNRNWGFHWNEGGTSNDPCSEIYCGPRAFSEVETKTISEFLQANARAKKIDAYIAFHSYSQLLMFPWGYTDSPAPLRDVWKRIGDAAARDLAAVNKAAFGVGDVYDVVYPVSGTSLEWYYGNYNSTIAYVYELRDRGQYGFVLPPRFILPSAKELYASVQRILVEYDKLPPKNF